VAFGGILHKTSITINSTPADYTSVRSFYWNRETAESNDNSLYSSCTTAIADCKKCKSGGRGFLAIAVFCFLTLMVLGPLLVLKIFDRDYIVPTLGTSISLYNNGILGMSFACTFMIFLMTVIWGATCYKSTRDGNPIVNGVNGSFTLTALGFGYIAFTLFVQIGATTAIFLARRLENKQGSNPSTGLLQNQTTISANAYSTVSTDTYASASYAPIATAPSNAYPSATDPAAI